MIQFVGTLLFLLVVTIVTVRLMGKSALAQFTPHDFIMIFFIITFALKPIEVDGIGQALIGIAVVITVHIALSKLNLYRFFNRYTLGEPSILIKHGKLVRLNLEKNRFPLRELLSSIRSKGFPDIKDIQYAILEPNGDVSVLGKEHRLPVTPEMLGHQVEYQGLPIAVVVEGKIQYHNLSLIQKDEQWLMEGLEAAGYPRLENIFYATVRDTDHSLKVDNGKGNVGTV